MEERYSEEFSKYLTYSDRDRLWGIYCTCLGWTRIQPGSPYPLDPAQHPQRYVWAWKMGQGTKRMFEDEFQLHYITRGQGTLYQGADQELKIDVGSVFFLIPGVPHWYAPDPEVGWDEHWVGFTGEYALSLLERRFISPRRSVLHVGLAEAILDDFQLIIEIGRLEPPAFQQRLGALVVNLLAQVRGFAKERKLGSEAETVIQQARFRFLENLARPLDIEEFAREFALDYPSFRRLFKASTGPATSCRRAACPSRKWPTSWASTTSTTFPASSRKRPAVPLPTGSAGPAREACPGRPAHRESIIIIVP